MSWKWAVASSRGTSHIRDGTGCDDVAACAVIARDTICAVVSDGAGSATFGKQGALLTARTIVRRARQLCRSPGAWPSDDDVWNWLDEARDTIGAVAAHRGADSRQFAATLVACFAGPHETLVAHIGDGACVLQTKGEWTAASWPESGEYASTTYFVTDSGTPRLRLTRHAPADAVAVFTDGIERLVLGFAQRTVHAPFFDRFIKPVVASAANGRDPGLSSALHDYLAGPVVTERTDDDTSLILAARR